jgi:phage-related protein
MPKTTVVFYREDDGMAPILEWFDSLPEKALDKCTVRIERLQELGHELRRPEADFLRDGIYELRVGLRHVNYRMLYFFHGSMAAVISHGITKEDRVPTKEIEKAIARKARFLANPELHTYVQEQL